jgi:hypothetical protein
MLPLIAQGRSLKLVGREGRGLVVGCGGVRGVVTPLGGDGGGGAQVPDKRRFSEYLWTEIAQYTPKLL